MFIGRVDIMENKFSKAMFGYNKKKVSEILDNMNDEFDLLIKEYEVKENELKKENMKLLNELKALNDEMKDADYLNDKLSEILYNSHIKAITPIYNEEKKFDEMVVYKSELIRGLQEKNEKINSDIKGLISKINELINN